MVWIRGVKVFRQYQSAGEIIGTVKEPCAAGACKPTEYKGACRKLFRVGVGVVWDGS